MSVYLVQRARPVSAPAGPHGNRDGGCRVPLRDSDRASSPTRTAAGSRSSSASWGWASTWMLVGVISAPWAIIALWGLWGSRTRSRAAPTRRGSRTRWASNGSAASSCVGARLRYVGGVLGLSRRSRSASARCAPAVMVGGAITVAVRCALRLPDAGDRFSPPPARRARIRAARDAQDRRHGGAATPGPRR